MTTVHHRYAAVEGRQLFYRDAGPPGAPVVVLLHGFPASSFMFRDLIPVLADQYHVIAPDYLGFGLSAAPPADEFGYSFGARGRDRSAARPAGSHPVCDVRARLWGPNRLPPGSVRPGCGHRDRDAAR
jgi:pimeloyl-ACP methyl ester carboxylesterase